MPNNTLADSDPILSKSASQDFTGKSGSYLDLGHSGKMATQNMTVSLSFTLGKLWGTMALISKDGSGRGDGGGFSVYVQDGAIVVVQDSRDVTSWLKRGGPIFSTI